jgi:ribosomal-protein-serine acetyltransferase
MFKINIDQDIELRLLEKQDAAELFLLIENNRAHLREWLPWLDSSVKEEDTANFIRMSLEKFYGNKAFETGIWYKGKIAGVIGLHEIDWPNEKTAIGYWIGKEYQGKGLITKACKAAIKHIFEELNLKRLEIRCATENLKSRAIPVRLGFTEEKVIEAAEFLYDRFVDHVLYSMTKENFQKQ